MLRRFRQISQDVEAARHQSTAPHQREALSEVLKQLHILREDLTLRKQSEPPIHPLLTKIIDRLPSLLPGRSKTHKSYASLRFDPIITSWRELIDRYAADLAEAKIVNPYIFGLPLQEWAETFVGRGDVSAEIEELLLDQRHPPLLLYGQKRMGKTSLLYNLGQLLLQLGINNPISLSFRTK